jgi:hypothetical protein
MFALMPREGLRTQTIRSHPSRIVVRNGVTITPVTVAANTATRPTGFALQGSANGNRMQRIAARQLAGTDILREATQLFSLVMQASTVPTKLPGVCAQSHPARTTVANKDAANMIATAACGILTRSTSLAQAVNAIATTMPVHVARQLARIETQQLPPQKSTYAPMDGKRKTHYLWTHHLTRIVAGKVVPRTIAKVNANK